MDPVILIFAGIAAFFIFKLLSALGESNGESDNSSEARNEIEALRRTLSSGMKKPSEPAADQPNSVGLDNHHEEHPKPVRAVSPAVRPLVDADPHFDEKDFLDGAKAAYEMIIEAFTRGDVSGVRKFLANNVYQAFETATNTRSELGHTADLKFVGIEKAAITDASVTGDAMIAVADFTSNQVRVTHDKDGNVVDGDPVRIDLVKDRWTFSRKRNSKDPNWILVATGAAS